MNTCNIRHGTVIKLSLSVFHWFFRMYISTSLNHIFISNVLIFQRIERALKKTFHIFFPVQNDSNINLKKKKKLPVSG